MASGPGVSMQAAGFGASSLNHCGLSPSQTDGIIVTAPWTAHQIPYWLGSQET